MFLFKSTYGLTLLDRSWLHMKWLSYGHKYSATDTCVELLLLLSTGGFQLPVISYHLGWYHVCPRPIGLVHFYLFNSPTCFWSHSIVIGLWYILLSLGVCVCAFGWIRYSVMFGVVRLFCLYIYGLLPSVWTFLYFR